MRAHRECLVHITAADTVRYLTGVKKDLQNDFWIDAVLRIRRQLNYNETLVFVVVWQGIVSRVVGEKQDRTKITD